MDTSKQELQLPCSTPFFTAKKSVSSSEVLIVSVLDLLPALEDELLDKTLSNRLSTLGWFLSTEKTDDRNTIDGKP